MRGISQGKNSGKQDITGIAILVVIIVILLSTIYVVSTGSLSGLYGHVVLGTVEILGAIFGGGFAVYVVFQFAKK